MRLIVATLMAQAPKAAHRSLSALSPLTLKSSTALSASLIPLDAATKAAAVSFFTGMRVPAILVSGSSLAGLFALSRDVKDTSHMPRAQILLYRVHHLLCLLSLCLSLTCVVTSTTATTLLLLSRQTMVSTSAAMEIDAYHFLKTSMPFEFLYTRWSFLVAVLFFLGSTMTRLLLEFDLFKGKRRVAGWGVFCAMLGVQSFLVSYVNTTQHCWLSMFGLTREIFRMLWIQATSRHQPMMVFALSCFFGAFILCIKFLLPNSIDHDQIVDHENFT